MTRGPKNCPKCPAREECPIAWGKNPLLDLVQALVEEEEKYQSQSARQEPSVNQPYNPQKN